MSEIEEAIQNLQAAVQKAQDLLGKLSQCHDDFEEIQALIQRAEGEAGASQTLTELIGVCLRGLEMVDHASQCAAEVDQTGGNHIRYLSQFIGGA